MVEADRERYREARAAGIAQHGKNVMLYTPLLVLHPYHAGALHVTATRAWQLY